MPTTLYAKQLEPRPAAGQEVSMAIIAFIIGLIVGAVIGVLLLAIVSANGRDDDDR